jgi:DNA-binding beta-propeller fold protein YncE
MRRVLFAAILAAGCGSSIRFPSSGGQWPAPAVPAFVHEARFATTQNLSDKLDFISPSAPTLLGSTPVGDVPVELEGPHHLAASPDGKYIYYNLSNYVPGTGSGPHGSHGTGAVPGSLVKLDASTNQELAEVLVDRSPGDVILASDGKHAYVSHYDLLRLQQQLAQMLPPEAAYSDLAIVDTTTMTRTAMIPVCVTAHGEGLSADGKTLYMTCAQSDELAVVDVSDPVHPTVKLKLPVGPTPVTIPGSTNPSYGPYALAVSPADGTVWVSDNNSADVRVFDPATMQMDGTKVINVNGVAMFGSFSPDGSVYYVPHQGDDRLTAIDTKTLATRDLPAPTGSCLNMHAFVLAPPSFTTGIVICEGDHVKTPGSALYVDVQSFTAIGYVTLDMFSDGAAWLPPL